MDRKVQAGKYETEKSESPGAQTGASQDLLVTGIVRSSHGVGGFVKLETASGEVDHFADLDEVVLRTGGANGVLKSFFIEAIDGSASCFLVKFRGIDTPEQAKALSGAEVLVPRDRACPLEKGEFYVADLCQCVLVYQGTPLGTITGVLEGGAGDLLEVSLSESDEFGNPKLRACLVPFRKEFVGKVDMKAKTVELMHRWILE
jgi:16S rRNA processing protein RimM